MGDELAGDWDTQYPPNTQVVGVIQRVYPFMVIVGVEPGVTGVIRRREWDWEEVPTLEDVARVGDRIEAIVLDADDRRRQLNLSRKRVTGDPWVKAEENYPIDSVQTGTVVNRLVYGAFVELEPGLVGLLHKTEVPNWAGESIEDVLWTGDVVKAQVIDVDAGRRRLGLSIKDYLAARRPDGEDLRVERATLPIAEQLGPGWEEVTPEAILVTRPENAQIQRILVLVDELDPYEPLVTWLERQGYTVDMADFSEDNVEEAIELGYDLVLAVISLSQDGDVRMVQRIQQDRPGTHLVLIGGPDWEDVHRDLRALQATDLLMRPLDYGQLARLLEDLEEGEIGRQFSSGGPRDNGPDLIQSMSAPMNSGGSLESALEGMLKELCERTDAEAGFVFEMDPVTRDVSIIAQVGNAKTNGQFRYELQFSPVKDVIRGREHIQESNAPRNARAKFSKLLRFVHFRSCIGLPIELSSRLLRHGLFIIHSDAGQFDQGDYEQARVASILMRPTIEQRIIQAQVQGTQRFLLSGQLSLGMAHEISNKLTGIEGHLVNLEASCEQLASCGESNAQTWTEVTQRLKEIRSLDEELRDLIHGYLGLMQSELQEIDLHTIINRISRELGRLAYQNKVRIELELEAEVSRTVAIEAWLKQVFLNVMLNAIQQIAEKRAGVGTLTVRTEYQPDVPLPFKIYFKDDGPGIHTQHLEQIYELGFSTKTDGVGLGLFISRGLIESMGGKISVEESVMLVGTTFLVELPLNPWEGVAR